MTLIEALAKITADQNNNKKIQEAIQDSRDNPYIAIRSLQRAAGQLDKVLQAFNMPVTILAPGTAALEEEE